MSDVVTKHRTEIRIQGILIDPVRWKVLIEGRPISLTSDQFRLLHLLATSKGRVFTRKAIIEYLHGADHEVTDHSVDAQIFTLRKQLGDYGHLIQTVRGVGYCFRV